MSDQTSPAEPSASIYRSASKLALLLICLDIAFVFIHWLHIKSPWLNTPIFSIETDRGLAEILQYAKLILICSLLFLTARRTEIHRLYSWAALFLFIVIDDAFSLHEQFGNLFSDLVTIDLKVERPGDIGELLFLAGTTGVIFMAIGLCFWTSKGRFRSITYDLFLMTACLAVFGVAVDFLHGFLNHSSFANELGLIEDGGEMFAMSLIVAYSWLIYKLPFQSQPRFVERIWSFIRTRFTS